MDSFSFHEENVFTEENLSIMGFSAPIFKQFLGCKPSDLEWDLEILKEILKGDLASSAFTNKLLDFFFLTRLQVYNKVTCFDGSLEQLNTAYYNRRNINRNEFSKNHMVLKQVNKVYQNGLLITETDLRKQCGSITKNEVTTNSYDSLNRLTKSLVSYAKHNSAIMYTYGFEADSKLHSSSNTHLLSYSKGGLEERVSGTSTITYNGSSYCNTLKAVTKEVKETLYLRCDECYTVDSKYYYDEEGNKVRQTITSSSSSLDYSLNPTLGLLCMAEDTNAYEVGKESILFEGKTLVKIKDSKGKFLTTA